MQLRLDRFTFQNDKRCFIELGSEQQATKAVGELNGAKFMNQDIIVKPLKDDFVWGLKTEELEGLGASRFFDENETRAFDAAKPLLEGRRMIFCVQPPGWGDKHSSIGHNKIAIKLIKQYLGKYGLEAVGGIQPFYGDMKPHPRMLCFLDFKTKAGADQAVQEIHNTEIEGRKVWLKLSELAPWRAHQIGKINQSLLAELQEKGVAPMETYEDNFVNSDKKNWNKKAGAARAQANKIR